MKKKVLKLMQKLFNHHSPSLTPVPRYLACFRKAVKVSLFAYYIPEARKSFKKIHTKCTNVVTNVIEHEKKEVASILQSSG